MSGKRSASLPRFSSPVSRWGVSVGVVAAVAAAALSFEAMGTASAATLKTVTLTVDGVDTTVTSGADSVGALLDEQAVTLDSTDSVSPQTADTLTDGMTVGVDHVSLVTVVDNGASEKHLVSADTVAQTQDELSLPAPVFTSLSTTRYETVRYRRTVMFGPSGRALAAKDAVRDGTKAVVQDVRVAYPTWRKRVHLKARSRTTPLLAAGTHRVMHRGHDGAVRVTVRRFFVEGARTQQRVVHRTWLRRPERAQLRAGTGPNWAALARCESGGNPNAVNPAGFYGLYQFSLSTWRSLGGTGSPTDYGYWGQTRLAWKLYQQQGRSPWPVCGAYL